MQPRSSMAMLVIALCAGTSVAVAGAVSLAGVIGHATASTAGAIAARPDAAATHGDRASSPALAADTSRAHDPHITAPPIAGGADPPTVALTGEVLPDLDHLPRVDDPPADEVIHVGLALRGRDPAGLHRYVDDLYTPGTAVYHHYLTPSQYSERFAADPDTYRAALTWLSGGSLTVSQTTRSRTYIQATGTVDAVQRLFHVAMHQYRKDATTFYANATAPLVPRTLGVISVLGLDSLQRFTTPLHRADNADAKPRTSGLPDPTNGSVSGVDLWSVYDEPFQNRGQGQAMAIITAGSTADVVPDLRRYESKYGLPKVHIDVLQVGAGPFTDTTGALEWNLDTQASTVTAPLVAREDLYDGATLLNPDITAAIAQWASDDVDPQASASLGECEDAPNTAATGFGLEAAVEPMLQEAVAQGQTLFAAAGDSGSFCSLLGRVPNGVYGGDPRQEYPAVSPEAAGVGGTFLYLDDSVPPQRGIEAAWTHSGGGSSLFIPAPKFQQGDPNVIGRCVTDTSGSPGAGGALCRGVPDVAAFSGGNGTGFPIVYRSTMLDVEGTSLSTPLWLGVWTRLQAAAPDQVNGLGFADPLLYATAEDSAKYARDFFDVVAGDNGIHHAAPGWDYITGWGVPDVAKLMQDIDGTTAASPSPHLRARDQGTTTLGVAPPPTYNPVFVATGMPASYPSPAGTGAAAPTVQEQVPPPSPSPSAHPGLPADVRAKLATAAVRNQPRGSGTIALLVALAVMVSMLVTAAAARSRR